MYPPSCKPERADDFPRLGAYRRAAIVFLEREVQTGADHVALVGLAAEVNVVEHRAAEVFAELRGDAGSGEDAVAVWVGGFFLRF